jgi:GntR family transcriptional regulator
MPKSQPAPAAAHSPSFSPLYQQIKELLTRALQGGEWRPGAVIPSEVELAARFKVSQGTVRKAIDELAAENLLVRRQGKGTYVATHAEERTQYRFLRLVPDAGDAPALQRRLLDCRRRKAPPEVARALALRGADALQVRRLLIARVDVVAGSVGQPVVFDDLWLPAARFRGLTAEVMQAHRGTLYGLFESGFGVHMVRADEQLRAVAATPEVAALLQVSAGTPLLQVQRLSYTWGDEPVEWRRGLYLTEHHHYRNLLT